LSSLLWTLGSAKMDSVRSAGPRSGSNPLLPMPRGRRKKTMDKAFTLIISNDSVFILKSISQEAAIIAARYKKEETTKITLREVVAWLNDPKNYREDWHSTFPNEVRRPTE